MSSSSGTDEEEIHEEEAHNVITRLGSRLFLTFREAVKEMGVAAWLAAAFSLMTFAQAMSDWRYYSQTVEDANLEFKEGPFHICGTESLVEQLWDCTSPADLEGLNLTIKASPYIRLTQLSTSLAILLGGLASSIMVFNVSQRAIGCKYIFGCKRHYQMVMFLAVLSAIASCVGLWAWVTHTYYYDVDTLTSLFEAFAKNVSDLVKQSFVYTTHRGMGTGFYLDVLGTVLMASAVVLMMVLDMTSCGVSYLCTDTDSIKV